MEEGRIRAKEETAAIFLKSGLFTDLKGYVFPLLVIIQQPFRAVKTNFFGLLLSQPEKPKI
jgi:hypothetical protein